MNVIKRRGANNPGNLGTPCHPPSIRAAETWNNAGNQKAVIAFCADGLEHRRAKPRLRGDQLDERPHAPHAGVGAAGIRNHPLRTTLSPTITVPGRESFSAQPR